MKTFTIKEISEELNSNATKIRRSIKKLGLEAVNEHTREYTNIPKQYSEAVMQDVKRLLESETTPSTSNAPRQASAKQPTSDIIEILQADKARLLKEIEDLKQDKRDQEQRFHAEKESFHNLLRLEKQEKAILEIELKETKDTGGFFSKLFKRPHND